jgi:hypothetical protein
MRLSATVVFAAFALAACTDAPVGPRQSLSDAPTLQLSHIEGGSTEGDLCNGLSPCDAFDYRGNPEENRVAGICFLPPTVDNHLSDPACSAPNQPGLSGLFQLTYCEVEYDHDGDGIDEPNVAPDVVPGSCLANPKPLVEESGHYAASFQWKKNGPGAAAPLSIFRVYVVRDGREYAHRDVIIDPNLTSPADGYVHAIGYGTEPFKLVITEDFSCVKYDTQSVDNFNAASCLITGGETVQFDSSELTGTGYESVTFTFDENSSESPFFADFEISECFTLGFTLDPADEGEFKPLVDTPLADCKISLSSDQIETLNEPATFTVTLTDPRWDTGGEFQHARLNVLEYDELGVGALPPAKDPGWLATKLANSSVGALRWLGRGMDMLASLLLPEDLYAALGTGAGWNVSRMSDLQIAVMPMMESASGGSVCSNGLESCTDLGGFPSGSVEEVSVYVRAPRATYDGGGSIVANIDPDPEDASRYIPVPDTRLHFFPTAGSGEVSCQSTLLGIYGRGCVEPGSPDRSTYPESYWDHVVVITDEYGLAKVDWDLADGPNVLNVVACGVAREGDRQPTTRGFYNEWGNLASLSDGQDSGLPCFDRSIAMVDAADYDNGPADGFTPFEPVDTVSEAALYAPPLTFLASTCPAISVDGLKGATEWSACADSLIFTAPQKGPKVENNAKLFWYSDGDTLFVAVEVASTEIGNKMFIQLTESNDDVERAGDELLVLDQLGTGTGGLFQDWHNTQQCIGNNSSSLCGAVDTGPYDGAYGKALVNGHAFYEFKRALNGLRNPKEDLAAVSGEIGIRVVLTQGQGGGKGGFVFPDPQTSATKYRVISID